MPIEDLGLIKARYPAVGMVDKEDEVRGEPNGRARKWPR